MTSLLLGLLAASLCWLIESLVQLEYDIIDLADPQHHATDEEDLDGVDESTLKFLIWDKGSKSPLTPSQRRNVIETSRKNNRGKRS